jgi:hypothetical protein
MVSRLETDGLFCVHGKTIVPLAALTNVQEVDAPSTGQRTGLSCITHQLCLLSVQINDSEV